MCGLYSFRKSAAEVQGLFGQTPPGPHAPRDHVAPGGPMLVLMTGASGVPEFRLVRWGLVPGWVKEIKPGKPLINARSETVLEKASFKAAMKHRRCLVPADGFYEWMGEPGRKQAFHIARPDGALFAFAGLAEQWMAPDGSEIESAAIITTAANETVGRIHNRMPAVIAPQDYARWLDCKSVSDREAAQMLKPAAEDFFTAVPVTMPRRDGPPKPPPPVSAQLDLF